MIFNNLSVAKVNADNQQRQEKNMNTGWKIAISVFFGALIGSLVSINYSWWIGMIVGGIVGYLSVEPMAIPKAIAKVFKSMYSESNRNKFKFTGKIFVCLYLSMCFVIVTPVFPIHAFGIWLGKITLLSLYFYEFTFLIAALFSSIVISITFYGETYWKYENYMLSSYEISQIPPGITLVYSMQSPKKYFKSFLRSYFNIVTIISKGFVIFFIIMLPMFIFWKMPVYIFWKIPIGIGKFTWAVVKIIHCHNRVIAGIDAVIFACLGYGLSYLTPMAPLIGAVIGFALSKLHWELVSVRWLKVCPQKIKND